MSSQLPDPHHALRAKFREIMQKEEMLWGMEIEPYDLLEKDTRFPLASINLANEEGLLAEACGRFRITITGYDEDPRPPFQIQEVQQWFQTLDRDCPHFLYFLEPELWVTYAASLVRHSYEDRAITFPKEEIRDFALQRSEAIEQFCQKAKISSEETLRLLQKVFGLGGSTEFPHQQVALPENAFLLAIDLGRTLALYGEDFWRRIDSACLSALSTVFRADEAVSVWGHLEEDMFGLFFAGDVSEAQAAALTTHLLSRFPSTLSEGEWLAPTERALPFWGRDSIACYRFLAEDDPDEGAVMLVVAYDGETWDYDAYEADEYLHEIVENIEGVQNIIVSTAERE